MIETLHIAVAMKPLGKQNFAEAALSFGVSGLNVDRCRVPTNGKVQSGAGSTGFGENRDDGYIRGTGRQYQTQGRFPANVVHDGSGVVVGCFPIPQSQGNFPATQNTTSWKMSSKGRCLSPARKMDNTGSSARFFKECPDYD